MSNDDQENKTIEAIRKVMKKAIRRAIKETGNDVRTLSWYFKNSPLIKHIPERSAHNDLMNVRFTNQGNENVG